MTEQTLAEKWWANSAVVNEIEEGLWENEPTGFDFQTIRTDNYDSSIEIDGVPADYRLTQDQSDWLKKCGFDKIYVNHTDGWETHYSPGSTNGWRRRYVSDPEAKTTNVIAGPPNPGYFETNHFPKGFPKDWLKTGYFRVVPDLMQPNYKGS